MPNRVLFIAPAIKPGGGAPGYVYNLMTGINNLSESELIANEFHFLGEVSRERYKATGEKRPINRLRHSAIKFFARVGAKRWLSRKFKVGKIEIDKADLVIIQGFQDLTFARYAYRANKRIAYMPHSPSIMADEYKMLCELNGDVVDKKKYERLVVEEATLIELSEFTVFPSTGASEAYQNKFKHELKQTTVTYIKSGVHIQPRAKGPESLKPDSSRVRVMFSGRYVGHKGYDIFCEAASLVSDRLNAEFVSLGAGPMRNTNKLVTDLGWQNDVFSFLNTADIVVVPNRIAYYDLLPLECAALGKPLVMTAVGGNVDQMYDLPDTILCANANSSNLAEAIEDAIRRLNENRHFGLGNLEAYENIFTAEKFALRWDETITELLGSA